ncbi:MAG: hypothetical protein Q9M37_03040 [Desulfonauticus sp.]|nr:hypothetical protein [Desulfonauticus sp.]
MSTIMDKQKLERAIKWIDEGIKEGKSLLELIEKVGMHFNLSPNETQFLERTFLTKKDTSGKNVE